ncbi:MAG: glucose-6-phosphate isomerase [Puniceicoccales bacterium]|jgi:glucose-6-phosphate isomerase|nr:glucose-6-phosphate isomerase [Puniceicoccales bacterium]
MDDWSNFERYLFRSDELGMTIDFSKIGFSEKFFSGMAEKIAVAHREMAALEAGAVTNRDENRMVGHYWLRNPNIAPFPEIQENIDDGIEKILKFAEQVHLGHLAGQDGKFENALCIGIGGSALGPQLICGSLDGDNKINCYFIDNTDPDGIDLILKKLEGKLGRTLVVVTSKSGSTPEPRNAMAEVMAAYEKNKYTFSRHAVAITGQDSLLDKQAHSEGWIGRFPMWEWVGGRTSVFSAVGLLPAALQGISIKSFLAGARDMDSITRIASAKNPAMMMALAWYCATDGVGKKDMVVMPYKDRLSNFAKYLQQLIMESLGKEKDRNGNVVRQGLTVYGNKGSTDQHSFIQQLRDGLQNFFMTIISVLKSRNAISPTVDPNDMTSGDYLNGFALGTAKALCENGTGVIQISVDKFSEYELGSLIALYERVVGFYASMVNVNAYHQPGVEAGKKAAAEILQVQRSIGSFLTKNKGKKLTIDAIADEINLKNQKVLVFKLLEHMAANGNGIKRNPSAEILTSTYEAVGPS